LARHAQTPFARREVTAMKQLTGTLFWLATVAAAAFPVIAEAKLMANHNETLIRDGR
jgi:hypothetical protein